MNTVIEPSENAVQLPSSRSEERGAPVRLKVCHVVATTEGAPWMFEQLRELRDRYGYDVAAVVSGTSGPLIDKLEGEGIPHFAASFGFGPMRGMLRMPRDIFRLVRLFRRERFDIVQTHIFISMVYGRIAAWLADVPVRLSMIAGPFHLRAQTTSRWIERATYRMESMLIPSCEDSVRLCREIGIPEKRLSLIYYSADEKNFDPRETEPASLRRRFGWSEGTPVIGMVAYFYPRLSKSTWVPAFLHGRAVKGHEDLVRAAPKILAEFPEAKFLLVGCGWGEAGEAYMEEIRELVHSLNLEERVIFAGYQKEVQGILREVDVAVQASLDENLGGTLEALLMECPLVATRVGGMVDTVRDRETGLLANPSDPDDLARAIIEMLRDPERARAMGRMGRELIMERFTLGRTVADLSALYARLASEQKRKCRGYNPLVSVWRLVMAAPVWAYVGFRLLFVDTFLPIYLPIYLARARGVALRIRSLPFRLYHLMRPKVRGVETPALHEATDYKLEELSEPD